MPAYQYVNTFQEADEVFCADMHLNADYPHKTFKVLKVDGKEVVLESRGRQFRLPIKKDRSLNMEYTEIEQKSFYERAFGRRAARFKIYPTKTI